jgi:hypothetical protein
MDSKHVRSAIGIVVGVGLLAAAVGTELHKPRRKRGWHGSIAGRVPYDFRKPTLARFKSRWWNPRDRRLFTPRTFGVGWDVNLARLLKR